MKTPLVEVDDFTKKIENTANINTAPSCFECNFQTLENNNSSVRLRFEDEVTGIFGKPAVFINDAAPGSDVAVVGRIMVDGVRVAGSSVMLDCISPWFRVLTGVQKARSLPTTLEERLEEFAQFQEGWDSYSARPISRGAIERAKTIILKAISEELRLPKPFVAPTSAGGVGLEWTLESGKELFLEISPEGELSYLLVTPRPDGGETEIEDVIDGLAEVDKLFRSLVE